ncbi:MAG TPA: hypothetical protein DDW52_00220 [Planctomycetaceae bacterium]|nr:hypothetical protein [Planctomycetaceae bacterium]
MEAATISKLKKELALMNQAELMDAILRLARFKRDNKELLTYLLFMSHDEQAYADYLCEQIDGFYAETPTPPKKTIQKMLRWTNKCLRYSGNKETEVQVRIHFCRVLANSRVRINQSRVIENLFHNQINKIETLIEKLHEDLRFDFRQQLASL